MPSFLQKAKLLVEQLNKPVENDEVVEEVIEEVRDAVKDSAIDVPHEPREAPPTFKKDDLVEPQQPASVNDDKDEPEALQGKDGELEEGLEMKKDSSGSAPAEDMDQPVAVVEEKDSLETMEEGKEADDKVRRATFLNSCWNYSFV